MCSASFCSEEPTPFNLIWQATECMHQQPQCWCMSGYSILCIYLTSEYSICNSKLNTFDILFPKLNFFLNFLRRRLLQVHSVECFVGKLSTEELCWLAATKLSLVALSYLRIYFVVWKRSWVITAAMQLNRFCDTEGFVKSCRVFVFFCLFFERNQPVHALALKYIISYF